MGLFGRLFGKSDTKESAADRCNECGMEAGRHTEWCPAVAEREDDRDDRPRETSGGAAAPSPGG